MENENAIITARDRALQKVGRNIVNFQKMEAMLKVLLKLGNYSAPLSQLPAHFERQEAKLRTRPMGELVERAAKSLKTAPERPTQSVTEPWVSTHFTVEGENFGPLEWRREMRQVVRERNKLVHHMVVQFNPHSEKACDALSLELDAQMERILPAYRQLESMIRGIHEFGNYMSNNIDEIVAKFEEGGPSHDA